MDMDSIMAVSPATDVVEDNREILIIELPREDCGRDRVYVPRQTLISQSDCVFVLRV